MKWIALIFIIACGSLKTDPKLEAEKSALKWFSYLDQGFYEQVFLNSSGYLRDRVNKGKMHDMFLNRMALLGKNKIRVKKEESVLNKYRGLGKGEYVSIDFISDFEQRINVSERVVLKKDGSHWRVFDYFFY